MSHMVLTLVKVLSQKSETYQICLIFTQYRLSDTVLHIDSIAHNNDLIELKYNDNNHLFNNIPNHSKQSVLFIKSALEVSFCN